MLGLEIVGDALLCLKERLDVIARNDDIARFLLGRKRQNAHLLHERLFNLTHMSATLCQLNITPGAETGYAG